MFTIYLVDQQPIVTLGLQKLISESRANCICHSFSTSQAFLKATKNSSPDIVISDASFTDGCGIELMQTLKSTHPQVWVLFFTMHAQSWRVREIIKAKASGIVHKTSPVIEISHALSNISKGKTYYCPKIKDIIINLSSETENIFLTHRERQVLKLIAKGYISSQIASELCISENTVETHRRNLFQKFHIKNCTNLLSKAFDLGYIGY
jgi:DNA-binding NarL/FixJ family response regulator